ncbi:NAD(P)-dependent alcohol dehydrogenase [Paenibacillus daejeonensis]|uniref:NAD(P)-dependent alcohol dehydrogenase n=1 Tax=Paenibacillus daejeonensis TaxID=135193 RepID=UPI00037DF75E|nr:NAD(P)-dependent alcohol dehydrogenase [Paenibacillus daejeonensis]
MKAAVIRKYGKPDVLQVEEVQEPVLGSRDVKIAVSASSVNPVDFKTRSGKIFFISGLRFPKILGGDVAGRVLACGDAVQHLSPGDEVYGFSSAPTRGGAYAEVMCCKADRLAHKPVELSMSEAAAIPLAGSTAYQALYKQGELQPGMRVLITGATGGVGHFAVQLARAADCQVTGVCHSRNRSLAEELGCDEVIAYDEEDFRKRHGTYDLILDAAAKFGYGSCRPALTEKGIYVSTIPAPGIMLRHLWSRYASGRRGRFVSAHANTADLERMSRLVETGQLRPHIEHRFPLTGIADAHRLSETERVRGKIVIEIGE